jgi:hypothetical protein
VLFMPIRGGPEAAVLGWMAQFGALERDFGQKTLRQWKRAHLGSRSFTVLRHPLARAHWTFCNLIVTGALAEVRALLGRAYKVDLPKPGQSHADATAHRAAFLGFLRFARLSLSGQTGARVDPHIASQTAVLQGYAGFQGPDLVLREERLVSGLAFLAAEVGLACPPLQMPEEAAPFALDEIHDAELEAATREAYARDYLGFGFGDWRPSPSA